METTNTTPMVYLKDLLFSIAYRWKRILAVALVFAVAFALLSWVTDSRGSATAEKDAIVQDQYQREEKILLSKINVLKAGIEEAQDYLTDSVLMQLDPRAYYEIALTVFIDTDYQIQPEMSYQTPDMTAAVVNGYEQLLRSRNALLELSDKMDTEPEYLSDVLQISSDADNQTILIQAQYGDETSAKALVNAITSYLSGIQAQVGESVAEHSFTVLSQDIYKNDSMDIFDKQAAQLEKLDKLEEDLDKAELELAGLKPPVISTTPYTVKDAILPAVIGFIVGCFVMMLIIVIGFLGSSKIYSVRTARDRTNAKILCCARSGKRLLPDILWLRKAEGRANATLEQQLPLISANLQGRCAQGQQLLVSGSADPQLIAQAASHLTAALSEVKVLYSGNILTDADALSAVAQCDCAVLIEQCQYSQYTQLENAQELLRDHNKPLFGCVLIDG